MAIQVAEQDVRERAYALWEARGRPDGNANDDWIAAELEVKAELDAVSTPLGPLAAEAAELLTDSAKESPPATDETSTNTRSLSEQPAKPRRKRR